jgi:hypothetical protein
VGSTTTWKRLTDGGEEKPYGMHKIVLADLQSAAASV